MDVIARRGVRPAYAIAAVITMLALLAPVSASAAGSHAAGSHAAGSRAAGSRAAAGSDPRVSATSGGPGTVVGPDTAGAPEAPAGRSIVVLRGEPATGASAAAAARTVDRTVDRLTRRLSLRPDHVFRYAIHGFSTVADASQQRALRADPDVAYVAPDLPMTLTAQPLPPDFARVNANVAPMTHYDGHDQVTAGDGQRVDADIAILDTGIDDRHDDLDVVGGVDCSVDPRGDGGHLSGNQQWGDVLGHGTHVAGIAGALDNGIGTVGIAPGARLWSVRIFGRDIRGWTSNLLCGIDWVTAQRDPATTDHPERPRMEVANMSMRVAGRDDGNCGLTNHDPVHTAICASVAAGNVYAVAAGNERNDASVYIPASYDEVITVSALADFDGKPGGLAPHPADCHSNLNGVPDVDDTFADFSTHGHDVDLIAPGVCVYSTYPIDRGTYRTLSGTSMATPVVAGGVALYRVANPDATPAQVQAALIAAGSLDWATETDPDGVPEPLLDVRTAGALADFRLSVDPAAAGARPGTTTTVAVDIERTFAFPDAVELSVDGTALPAGATATISPASLPTVADHHALVAVTVPAGSADGGGSLTVFATGGSPLGSSPPVEHRVDVPLFVDSIAPVVSGPVASFLLGSVPGAAKVPLRLTWSGSDASGTQRYSLAESVDGGPWQAIGASSVRASGVTRWVAPDSRYAYRVSAVDAAGNATSADGTSVRLRARSEDSPRISYAGTWTKATAKGAYGGSVRSSLEAGATATVRFNGRAVAWLSPGSSPRGEALVFVDDDPVPVAVDLATAGLTPSRVVFARDWPVSGPHVVRIQVVGTAGRPRVDIDGILTLR